MALEHAAARHRRNLPLVSRYVFGDSVRLRPLRTLESKTGCVLSATLRNGG